MKTKRTRMIICQRIYKLHTKYVCEVSVFDSKLVFNKTISLEIENPVQTNNKLPKRLNTGFLDPKSVPSYPKLWHISVTYMNIIDSKSYIKTYFYTYNIEKH